MFRYCVTVAIAVLAVQTFAREPAKKPSAERGYRWLTEKAYLPPDFDQEVFDQLWTVWEQPLRTTAEESDLAKRREMAFERYGLTQQPNAAPGVPLQYVVSSTGQWSMNCFACHGGKVAGSVHAGLPNSLYALETLTEDVRAVKLRLGKKWTHMDLGSLIMPLGGNIGTTNSVMFGVALKSYRNPDLSIKARTASPRMMHHDHDAPPWWHLKRKKYMYIDGFAPKNHRALMQFLMVKENDREKFLEWEPEYADILTYIESVEPPKYPGKIDRKLAEQGRGVFARSCASCHGTYGNEPHYPERMVPIARLGTDRVRLDALTVEHRRGHEASWFCDYGHEKVIAEPKGYVAPPLDGIWATAPYLHNGSVPTLWHMLHPDERPLVWRRTIDGYDHSRVGLEVETFEEVPAAAKSNAQRRWYFDTRKFGKSAKGHDFPSKLTEPQRAAVLEYLKTL
jgi:mono/diheme cytochrome c family protein